LSIIQAFLGQFNTQLKTATESLTIEPEIVPYMIEDEQAKVDLLKTANGNKPIVSQKTTVEQLGWVNDSNAEYEQIIKEQESEKATDLFNPTD
jgi:hypothetical protein